MKKKFALANQQPRAWIRRIFRSSDFRSEIRTLRRKKAFSSCNEDKKKKEFAVAMRAEILSNLITIEI